MMKTEYEHIYLFDCEYDDGGEWYHLEVELITAVQAFYRCRINSIPDSLLFVDGDGILRRAWADQVVIDITIDENDQWIDLDFGNYSFIDKLGYLIEKYTL